MDWTVKDNMVNGLFFCATLTSHRWVIPHMCKQERKHQTPARRRLSLTHAVLGRVIPGGLGVDVGAQFSSFQFISASWPSTKYFIRTTGTESDGRSCHLSHCPHKFTQNNKIQMKHHSNKKNIHSKDSYSAVNSPHINTFWKHSHHQKSIPNCVWKHWFHTG